MLRQLPLSNRLEQRRAIAVVDELQRNRVLVTRPAEAGERLGKCLERHGWRAILAPVMAIEPIELDADDWQRIDLANASLAIFISQSAADYGIREVRRAGQSFGSVRLVAVGPATANILRRLGYRETIVPPEHFSSEGLLELEDLSTQQIRGRRVVIFRGRGGREHLRERLVARGAAVVYCEVYKRVKTPESLAAQLAAAGVSAADIAVVSSVEGLGYLAEKIHHDGLGHLFDMPLLVPGQRIATEAKKLGFTYPPVIADNPGDENVVYTLDQWSKDAHG